MTETLRSAAPALERHVCLEALSGVVGDALVITCIGGARAEWNHVKRTPDFTPYAMGLASSVALGLALSLPASHVIAIDGDGAFLMNLAGVSTNARIKPRNLLHLVFDNESYESSGGGETHTRAGVDLVAAAAALGYPVARWVRSPADLVGGVKEFFSSPQLTMLAIKVSPTAPTHVGGTPDTLEQKYQFIRHVEARHSIDILGTSLPAHLLEARRPKAP